MARTSIDDTYIRPNDDGVADPPGTEASADTTNGNTFTNDGQIVLAVTNTTAGSASLTIAFPAHLDVGGVSHPDKTVSIAASETQLFRFDPSIYGRDVAIDAPSGFTFYLIR